MTTAVEFLFLSIFSVSFLIYFFLKKKFVYFKDREIPFVEPEWLMGNLNGVGTEKHLCEAVSEVYEKCKGKDVICGFYNQFLPVYLIIDREVVKSILTEDFHYFVNRGLYINEESDPLTGNLFFLKDDRWRFMRSELSPAFTSLRINSMFSTIASNGKKIVNLLSENHINRDLNIEREMLNFIISIIGSAAFGSDVQDDHEKLLKIFKGSLGSGIKAQSVKWNQFNIFMINLFPNFSKFIGLKLFDGKTSKFIFDIVSKNVNHRKEKNVNHNDFLELLVQLKNDNKISMSDVIAQAFILFSTGAEYLSPSITFALMELSRNQKIQKRLNEEIEEKANGEITYEALNEMKYLEQIVNETLRMYPTNFLLFREALNDYKIPNSKQIIPKGSRVWIPKTCLHNDEKLFPNPQKFDPDRFSKEENEKRPPYSFIPFGEGPRICLGLRFALTTMKFTIATLVKNFQINSSEKTQWPIKMNPQNPLMESKDGCWIKINKI